MIKKTQLKDALRNIRGNRAAFLTLTLIIALGLGGFLASWYADGSMRSEGKRYLNGQCFKDFDLYCSLGITEEDVEALRETEGVEAVEGRWDADAVFACGTTARDVKVLSLTRQVSVPDLIEGRLPERVDECLVDPDLLGDSGAGIGETIELHAASEEGVHVSGRFTVTGTMYHPDYLRRDCVYTVVVLPEAFDAEAYSGRFASASVRVAKPEKTDMFSEQYFSDVAEARIALARKTDELKAHAADVILEQAAQETPDDGDAETDLSAYESNWIMLDRRSNAGYCEYESTIGAVGGAGLCFGLLFLFVVAMQCHSTLSLLIEEQRRLVGVTKAFGFYKREILAKYLIYALSAALLGSLLGVGLAVIAGRTLLLLLESTELYIFNPRTLQLQHLLTDEVLGGILLLCGVVSTVACVDLLRSPAASLMKGEYTKRTAKRAEKRRRPSGRRHARKRRSGSLYSHLIARNMWRDRGRVFTSIVVIAASCAMIGSGITVKLAYDGMNAGQLNEVYQFDVRVDLGKAADDATREQMERRMDELGVAWARGAWGSVLFNNGERGKDGASEDGDAAGVATGARRMQFGAWQLHSGAGELADGLHELDASTGDLSDGAAELRDGADELLDGAEDLSGGAGELADGARQLQGGAQDLADGLDTLGESTGTLADGAETLHSGSEELLDGAEALQIGASDLADGSRQASEGIISLAEGIREADAGSETLADGAEALQIGASDLADGVEQLLGGVGELSEGARQLQNGAQTLTDGLSEIDSNSDSLVDGARQILDAVIESASEKLQENEKEFASLGISLRPLTFQNYRWEIRRLQNELLDKVEAIVYAQADRELTRRVRSAVRKEVEKRVREAVYSQVEEAVRSAAEQKVREQVTAVVREQLTRQITAEARSRLISALRNSSENVSSEQIDRLMETPAVKDRIDSEVAARMASSEARNGIDAKLEAEARDEVEADYRAFAVEQATVRVRARVTSQVTESVRRQIRDQLADAASAAQQHDGTSDSIGNPENDGSGNPENIGGDGSEDTGNTDGDGSENTGNTDGDGSEDTGNTGGDGSEDTGNTGGDGSEDTGNTDGDGSEDTGNTGDDGSEGTGNTGGDGSENTGNTGDDGSENTENTGGNSAEAQQSDSEGPLASAFGLWTANAEEADLDGQVEQMMASDSVRSQINAQIEAVMASDETNRQIDAQADQIMAEQADEIDAAVRQRVEVKRPEAAAAAEAKTRAEVKNEIRERVLEAANSKDDGEIEAGVDALMNTRETQEQITAEVDKQMASEEVQRYIDEETARQMAPGSSGQESSEVQKQIQAEVDARMASDEVKQAIEDETDKQMASDKVKRAIRSNIEKQKNSAKYLNSVADALDANGKNSAAYRTLADLVERLSEAEDFYYGVVDYTDAVGQAAQGAGELRDAADALADGADTLDGGAAELSDGMGTLADGAQQLSDGARSLRSGISELADGAEELADGMDELTSGAAQLSDSADALASGAGDLVGGAGELMDGTAQLNDGVSRLTDGADELADGADELADGVSDLSGGAEQLSDGATALASGAGDLRDGASALVDGVDQMKGGVDALSDGAVSLSDGAAALRDEADTLAHAAPMSSSSGDERLDGALLLCADPASLARIIGLTDPATGKPATVDGEGILIQYRMAENLGLKPGDTLELLDERFHRSTSQVSGFIQNYQKRMIVMTPEKYEELFGKPCAMNSYFVRLSGVEDEALRAALDGIASGLSYERADSFLEQYRAIAFMYNTIVLGVTAIAILISFVILVNLAAVFVTRKKRELIIMRINGFTLRETRNYLLREVIATVVAGVLIGAIIGIPVGGIAVRVMETPDVQFVRAIQPIAWCCSVLLEMAFAVMIYAFQLSKIKSYSVHDLSKD